MKIVLWKSSLIQDSKALNITSKKTIYAMILIADMKYVRLASIYIQGFAQKGDKNLLVFLKNVCSFTDT